MRSSLQLLSSLQLKHTVLHPSLSAGVKRRTRDWPEWRSKEIVPRIIFNDGWIQNDFKDASWNAWMQPLSDTKQKGMLGGPGMCATVQKGVG